MVKDPVSQLVTSIKNGSAENKTTVFVPQSNMLERILDVLIGEGFIDSFSKKAKKTGKSLEVKLKQVEGRSRIRDARRISKLSRRVYRGFKDLRPYKNGLGLRILSTPKGVMSDKQARKDRIGGEVLFELW